jgi:hypothetical protein
MPPKPHRYDAIRRDFPWVRELDGSCLRKIVEEALIARDDAMRAGGEPGVIRSGTKTLEQIEMGRYVGDVACQKATVALRKFDEAYMGFPYKRSHPALPPGTLRG